MNYFHHQTKYTRKWVGINVSEWNSLLLLSSLSCCRCNTPIPLRNKRMVHFYSWKEKAFCTEMEQLRSATVPVDTNVNISSSGTMIYVMGGLAGLVLILVIIGIVWQRRLDRKYRSRNRRLWGIPSSSIDITARCCAVLSHFPLVEQFLWQGLCGEVHKYIRHFKIWGYRPFWMWLCVVGSVFLDVSKDFSAIFKT